MNKELNTNYSGKSKKYVNEILDTLSQLYAIQEDIEQSVRNKLNRCNLIISCLKEAIPILNSIQKSEPRDPQEIDQ